MPIANAKQVRNDTVAGYNRQRNIHACMLPAKMQILVVVTIGRNTKQHVKLVFLSQIRTKYKHYGTVQVISEAACTARDLTDTDKNKSVSEFLNYAYALP